MAMLKVFTNFHNTKALYKQEELWQLYRKVGVVKP